MIIAIIVENLDIKNSNVQNLHNKEKEEDTIVVVVIEENIIDLDQDQDHQALDPVQV